VPLLAKSAIYIKDPHPQASLEKCFGTATLCVDILATTYEGGSSMADREPWLSPFISGALGEYLEYLHKGDSMVGWKSEVKGKTTQISRKETFVGNLRTIEV
jgi:hypothetical protein